MKNFIPIFYLVITVFTNCKTDSRVVNIIDNISIRLPADYKVTKVGYQESIEAILGSDKINIFNFPLNLSDTLSLLQKKQYLTNNIDSFLKSFNFMNIDTLVSFHGNHIQSDISFDFSGHNRPKKFYGRFIVQNDNFIAICYQISDPNDKSSLTIKDELFTSIKIK